MRLGIGGRLLVAHLAISVLVIGAVELVLRSSLRDELTAQHEQRLELAARALADRVQGGEAPGRAAAEIARTTGFRLSLIGDDGFLLADSGVPSGDLRAAGSHAHRLEVQGARATGFGKDRRVSATTGIATRYVAVRGPGGEVARAAETESQLQASLGTAQRAVLGAGLVGLILAALLGVLASRFAERSFLALNTVARRLAEGDLASRAVVGGPREFREVGEALNRLAQQLSTQIDRLVGERDLRDAVLAAMEDAVLALRPDGRLLLANDAARTRLGLPAEAVGQPLVDSLRIPPLLDACRRAAAGHPGTVELTLHGPPRRELIGRAAPLPRGGSEAAAVVVLRDVTELRRLEAVRREFVANASHELRTPVATIRGYAETLAAGALADRTAAERFVAGLARQAERLTLLLDDLLDLSRIESGGLKLEPRPLPAAEALAKLADNFRERAAKKGLALVLEPVPPGLQLRADPRALDSMIGNLLDNAVKYTPAGGRVTLACVAEGRAARIDVRDTGPGIGPQHLPRIFERFYRVDPGRSREVGGTGLGLAIAKHLAQQSGGDIGVDSTPGAGSRFWVKVPTA
jgi:two-component system phosphate regulon sensor histidine kinase PhoR